MKSLIVRVSLAVCALFSVAAIQSAAASSLDRPLLNVTDTDPAPHVFEADLSVVTQGVDIDGTTVQAIFYRDDNNLPAYAGTPDGIPVPQIVVDVGDEVIVTLKNELPAPCAAVACDTSIHWHGIELDNDSDGTGVTQNHLTAGSTDTYTYRFIPPRPGVFWFHPHMLPGPQTFAGVYGALIVKDPNEPTLQGDAKIPPTANTHTIVLSDIEFDSGGNVGYIIDDDFDPMTPDVLRTWASLKEDCATMGAFCNTVKDGATVLVNGQNPAAGIPKITAQSGDGVRLRIINTSTNRYFRLALSGNGSDNVIYRIGGEGGFLEQVRVEGGMMDSFDTKYQPGEILVPASGRVDVVVVPTGMNGDIITISGLAYQRGGPSDNNPAGDLLEIEISGSTAAFTIADGQEILGADGIEDLKSLVITDTYADPTLIFDSNPGAGAGTDNPEIVMEGIVAGQLAINGVQGHFEDSGPDYTQVPYQGATRYARTGDTLEFTIRNSTLTQHHPFHHHGFSFQPVRILSNVDDSVLYEYDYEEFVDVIDVPFDTRIVLRMVIEDRPKITDNRPEPGAPAPNIFSPTGGAEGRWVFHCHLFLHATIGMISELVIKPNNPPVADAGPDQMAECASHSGTVLVMDGSGSSDPDMDPITYLWTAPGIVFDDPTSVSPSATFPLGATTVTLTVSDGALDDSDTMDAEIIDTTPPLIDVSLSPNTLWPPNHKLKKISSTVTVTDVCDPNPGFILSSASSNEPDNGKADGNTTGDIRGVSLGTEDTKFKLRAERSGKGSGRIYTIGYTAFDDSGNVAEASAEVTVPHNR